jgi:hypothetical protein
MAAPNSLPHSFVLADLFDVAAMSYPVPDHLLEDEPELEWILCPECDGEKWVEIYGFAWQTPPELCKGLRRCPRCKGHGEVLDTSLLWNV